MSSYLSRAQYDKLCEPINEGRIGKDGKGFRHLAAYECRAQMNRIFGFALWSAEVTDMELVFDTETKGEKGTRYTVCYRAAVELSVCAPDGTHLATYTEWATGEATNQPSRGDAHDLAIKTAESQAFKRAAVNLGDSFGISLYGGGSTRALVVRSLVVPDGTDQTAAPTAVDAHVTEVDITESEQVPARDDQHEQSAAPDHPEHGLPVPDEADARALRVADLVAQLDLATSKTDVALIAAQGGKERLNNAQCADGRTFGAHVDSALKRVSKASAA